MTTSDTLFDPTVYSTHSTMVEADNSDSKSTDSSYDRLSDIIEGEDTRSNVTDIAEGSGDHKDCPYEKLSSGEESISTTEQTGQNAKDSEDQKDCEGCNGPWCEGCIPTTEQPDQTAVSQASDHTADGHDTHSSDETILEANPVRNGDNYRMVLVLLVFIAARGDIWVTVIGLVAMILWYRFRGLGRASDDAAEHQVSNSQHLDQSWKDKGPMGDKDSDFGCSG